MGRQAVAFSSAGTTRAFFVGAPGPAAMRVGDAFELGVDAAFQTVCR